MLNRPVLVLACITVFVTTFTSARAVQFTELSDTASGTLTTAESPYLVSGLLLVPAGRVLTVNPGVTLRFRRGAKLRVEGALMCRGTIHHSIRFTAEQSTAAPGGWEGIYFTDENGKGSFSHCIIEYSTAGIYCELASDVTVEHCILQNNRLYGIYCIGYSSPTITDNVIENSNYGVVCYEYSSPEIARNTIRNTQLAGIYCFICSNPHIDGNVITRNRGVGVFCLDMSMPLVENNLVTGNMNGIRCTNASPFIMRNTVCDNDYFGVACVNSSAQIVYNNIFGNSLYDIDVLERDFIMPAGNWWGADAYGTVDDADGTRLTVKRDKVNGPVALEAPAAQPLDIPVGAPASIRSVTLQVEPEEGRNDLAHIGDRLMVRVTGTDGSSSTRDYLPLVLQHRTEPEHVIRILGRETGENTGEYTGTFPLDERASAFIRAGGWQASEPFRVYTPGFEARGAQFHLVNRRPEITSFTIRGAGVNRKITARNQVTFAWTYPDYGDGRILDRPVNLEVSTDENFNRNSRVLLQELTGNATSYACAPGLFEQGRTYFARLRMRDFDSWKTNKTMVIIVNRPPAAPAPAHPQPGAVITDGLWVKPAVLPASDPDRDRLIYRFELYADSAMAVRTARGEGVPAAGRVQWDPDRHLDENGTYWWRACADDGYDRTWSPLHRFSLDLEGEPLRPFGLTNPGPDALLASGSVTFTWEPAVDPDPGAPPVRYTFWLSANEDFSDKIEVEGLPAPRYRMDRPLEPDREYYWKVMAENGAGEPQWSNTRMEPFNRFRVGTPH